LHVPELPLSGESAFLPGGFLPRLFFSWEPLIKVGMPHLGMPHHDFRHVGVREVFQKVVDGQQFNNFSPLLPSLP